VLGVCIAVLAGLIGSELWLSAGALLYSAPAPAARTQSPAADGNNAEQIAAASLFGRAAQIAGGSPEQQTDLQLTLRGVFTASDPSHASAMLEGPDGRVQIVRVGGGIAPETTLQQVYSNRIVLARNGAQESLYFPTPQSSESAAATEGTATAASAAGAVPAPSASTSEDMKRAAILRRLEELRARSSQ
jgi:general secretion pathway protein C